MSDVERKKERKRESEWFLNCWTNLLDVLVCAKSGCYIIHVNMHGYNQMFPGKTRNLGMYVYILKNYYILCDKQD